MAKVQVNTSKLNVRPLMPDGIYIAEITACEYPFQAPWDPEDFGVSFEFQICEEGPHKGRKINMFCTTTEGKAYANRYSQVMTALGIEPSAEWDTDTIVGRKMAVRVGQYTSKTGTTRNSINEVFETTS